MKPGSVLDVQLVDDRGSPLSTADVSVDVVLYVGGKERYRFDAGVTDALGRTSISYEMLERSRKANASLSLMDYNTRLENCDSTVGLVIPTLQQLRDRLAAVRKWFPENESALSERVTNSRNSSVVTAEPYCVTTTGGRILVRLRVG